MSHKSEVPVYTKIIGFDYHRLSIYDRDALCAPPQSSHGTYYDRYGSPSSKAGTQTYDLTMDQLCCQWNIGRSPDQFCLYHEGRGDRPICIIDCQADWNTFWTHLLKKDSRGYETSITAQYFTIARRAALPKSYASDASNAAAAAKQTKEKAAQPPALDIDTLEKIIAPIITQAISSIGPTLTEAVASLAKQMADSTVSAVPTTIHVHLADSETKATRSLAPPGAGCISVGSSYETRHESSSTGNNPAAPGATIASSILTGLEGAVSRLNTGGAAASILASFLDSLKSELRNPSGPSQSPFQTDAEANENAPPAEPLRNTPSPGADEVAVTEHNSTDPLPSHSAAPASTTVDDDNNSVEQLSRSTSCSRSTSGDPSASEIGWCLCKSYDPDFAQSGTISGAKEMSTSTSTLQATPTLSSVSATTEADAAQESTLIDAFTEMLQKSREAGNRK